MIARNIAEIIHLDSHARTVEFKQNEEVARPPHTEHQPDQDQLKAAAGIINKLFSELQTCFPAWRQTFTSKADMDAVKRTWARGLIEAKITSYKQLQWGLLKARRSESPFWPSLGQFINWCQPDPEDFGLPTPEVAFKEASRNSHPASVDCKWTHPAVYVAAREAGTYELANLPRDKSWPLFQRAYSITVRRVLEGEDLSGEIPKALPQKPEPRSVDPKVAQQHIERLKKMLKGGK
ncbi:replication protein P [Vibrio cholerae]|uniref:replication protein P n=1 Tax=Vibrio cholerae TaxID=666 RepID=UPI001B027350|nr:replication protein P [Vibrio cholerae]EHG8656513.1 replication protein P [Salmonella enterica subsp. enterica serovar Montevideo]EHG8658692.1 replication protein P [Salmonella enterica subsp. enterica serovar Montevideo]